MERVGGVELSQAGASTSRAIVDLEQVTPVGRAVVQFLRQKRNGARLPDIVQHLRRDQDEKLIGRKLPELLTKGVALGFLERKNSRYCAKGPKSASPSDKCRRRRPRRCACKHRRHCCDRPRKRRRRC